MDQPWFHCLGLVVYRASNQSAWWSQILMFQPCNYMGWSESFWIPIGNSIFIYIYIITHNKYSIQLHMYNLFIRVYIYIISIIHIYIYICEAGFLGGHSVLTSGPSCPRPSQLARCGSEPKRFGGEPLPVLQASCFSPHGINNPTFPGDSLATLGMPIDQIPMLMMGPGA